MFNQGQARRRSWCFSDRRFVSDRLLVRGVDIWSTVFRQNGRLLLRQSNSHVSDGCVCNRVMFLLGHLGNRLRRTDCLRCNLRFFWSMLCALDSAGHQWHRWPRKNVLRAGECLHSYGVSDVSWTTYCRYETVTIFLILIKASWCCIVRAVFNNLHTYSRYWTELSFKWGLCGRVLSYANGFNLFVMIFPRMSLLLPASSSPITGIRIWSIQCHKTKTKPIGAILNSCQIVIEYAVKYFFV